MGQPRKYSHEREQEIVAFAKATGFGHKRVTKELGLSCSPMTTLRIIRRNGHDPETIEHVRCNGCGWVMRTKSRTGTCGFCQEEAELGLKIPANRG